jgi:hypothetical protein
LKGKKVINKLNIYEEYIITSQKNEGKNATIHRWLLKDRYKEGYKEGNVLPALKKKLQDDQDNQDRQDGPSSP